MAALRIVFMGTPAFAVPALVGLCERPDMAHVVGCFTQPDRPTGRGRKMSPAAVKVAAMARGVPCWAPTKMKDPQTRADLAALAPDLVVVAAYGRILPPALLQVPRLGCINVHASLLPRHRGASPIVHAILAGDAATGVCIMQMDAGLDTGPVFSRREVVIDAAATGGSLTVTLAEVGARLLVDTLPGIAAQTCAPVPQDDSQATYAGLIEKAQGWLDFRAPAAQLARQVRAFQPWPGSFVCSGAQRVGVLQAHADPSAAAEAEPGTVLQADPLGVKVATGAGCLWLTEVKPAGRQAMPVQAWVAGRGVQAGFVLASPHMENP